MLVRAETIALLRARIPDLNKDQQLADELAAELGDLPLAAAQAAGYLDSRQSLTILIPDTAFNL